jgi:hypothetical protein
LPLKRISKVGFLYLILKIEFEKRNILFLEFLKFAILLGYEEL